MTDEQLQLEIEAVPKRKAPLRQITKQLIQYTGPHGGARLYLFLECGHVQERPLKARYDELERARCHHCIGKPANHHELLLSQGMDESITQLVGTGGLGYPPPRSNT